MGETFTGTGSGNPPTVTPVGGSDYAGTPATQRLKVDANGGISVTANALPTGAATAAKQDTGNTSLATVATATAAAPLAGDGRKTVTTAGTAVALATSTTVRWVTATALLSNTAAVTVGTSSVLAAVGSTRGFLLSPGQAVSFPAANLSAVFVDSRVNGEGVAFAYGA